MSEYMLLICFNFSFMTPDGFRAPETFDPELGPVTKKSDIWALACLLLELQTGKVPWEGLNVLQIMTKVCESNAFHSNNPHLPLAMGSFSLCLTYVWMS